MYFLFSSCHMYNYLNPLVSVIVTVAQQHVGDNMKDQSSVYPKGLHLQPLEEPLGAASVEQQRQNWVVPSTVAKNINENKPVILPFFCLLFGFRNQERKPLLLWYASVDTLIYLWCLCCFYPRDLCRDWQVGMLVHAVAFVQAGSDCISHTWRLPWAYQPVISWLKNTQCLILSAFPPDGGSCIVASSMNAFFVFLSLICEKMVEHIHHTLTF